MVSTDDPEIAEIAKGAGAHVPFLRSAASADDFSTTIDVVREVIAKYEELGMSFESGCCIYPTAVLVTPDSLRASRNLLGKSGAHAVMPVVAYHHPIQRALKADRDILEMVRPEFESVRSQDLTKSYYDAGQFYWFHIREYLKAGGCLNSGAIPFEIEPRRSQDIDEEADWAYAEFKYQFFQSEAK
ncbi:pseudaminic acid cytidylyltransferase [soil metagenome]